MAQQLWCAAQQHLAGRSWKAVASERVTAATLAACMSTRLVLESHKAAAAASVKRAQAHVQETAKQVQETAKQVQETAAFSVRSVLALGLWLASPLLGFFSVPLALGGSLIAITCGDVHWHGLAALSGAYIAALALLVALPLDIRPPAWVQQALRWIISTGELISWLQLPLLVCCRCRWCCCCNHPACHRLELPRRSHLHSLQARAASQGACQPTAALKSRALLPPCPDRTRNHPAGMHYFPATLHFEDKDAFEPGKPYVLAYEPHSILPW